MSARRLRSEDLCVCGCPLSEHTGPHGECDGSINYGGPNIDDCECRWFCPEDEDEDG